MDIKRRSYTLITGIELRFPMREADCRRLIAVVMLQNIPMQRNTPEKNKCIKAGMGDGGDFRVYRAIKLQTFWIGSKWTVPFLGVNAKTLFWGQYPAVKRFRCSITLRAIYFCRLGCLTTLNRS